MTRAEYQTQLNRLAATFGPAAYQGERMELIWQEVGTLPVEAFKRIVNTLIGECRNAPLLPEIRKEAAIERERLAAREKANHSRESEQAYRSILSNDDIKHYCNGILRRVSGVMPDKDFNSLVQIMSGVARSK